MPLIYSSFHDAEVLTLRMRLACYVYSHFNVRKKATQLDWPVAVESKAQKCSRSIAGIAGSSPAGGNHVCLLCLLCVVYVQASATCRSFVQGSPTDVCHCV
jgi:hypothetical protein